MLEKALSREAALKRLEEMEKEAHRKEIIEIQAHYITSQNDKQAYEKMIDELVA